MRLITGRVAQRLHLDGFGLAVLLGFAVLSAWVLALDLWQMVVHGHHWTGTDGVFLVDQMTYLGWIQDASHHVLISNLFTIGHSPADFFEPLIAISGGLTALGVPVWVALLIWQPIAVLGVVVAARTLVIQTLGPSNGARIALVLALFFVGSGAVVASKVISTGPVAQLQLSAITSDLSLGFWSWGYSFGLVALAAGIFAILGYARNRSSNHVGWGPPLLGALASSVHPWQGGTVILVLLGAEALTWRRGERPRIRAVAATVFVTALPLLYFAVLNHSDPSWKLAQATASGSFPVWMVVVTVAPLALPAMLAYRKPAPTFLMLTTRLWPIAAVILFLFSETGFSAAPTHAFLGISIPLAVLAVDGVRASPLRPRTALHRAAIALLAAVAFVPATAYELSTAHRLVTPGSLHDQDSGPGDANFVTTSERRALNYLANNPRAGGVLTRFYLGSVVPGLTGRETYVGSPYYTPHYSHRTSITDDLFLGKKLSASAARTFAVNTGARFLLADCLSPTDIARELSAISSSVHRFGCATVFVVR